MPQSKQHIFFIGSSQSKKLRSFTLDEKLYKPKEPILNRKHHVHRDLAVLDYNDLNYKDLCLLKYWRENNFLVALDLKDLFTLKDENFLRLFLNRGVPLLLKTARKYIHGPAKGPIKLNLALLFLDRKIEFFSKIRHLSLRGFAFLTLKNVLDEGMVETLDPGVFRALYD